MKNVLIIQSVLKQYRVPFYEKLQALLKDDGITLHLAYSQPDSLDSSKSDNVILQDDYSEVVNSYWLMSGRLLYQPVLNKIRNADLIIVEQANKHLLNYLLNILSTLGIRKVGYWGHGYNRQGDSSSLSERIKRITARHADWWFAYTPGTADYYMQHDILESKITIVNNSTDTHAFKQELVSVRKNEIDSIRQKSEISPTDKVGLYCGSLYTEKRLAFLVEAARLIHEQEPSFHLVIIGSGPDREYIKQAAESYTWLHYEGALFGQEKAAYFRIANLFLNPGLVGLAILDAFAAGLPMITTDISYHSPEIEYLEHEVNGLLISGDELDYANAVIKLINDEKMCSRLKQGAQTSSEKYTIENMAHNFSEGIKQCLEMG